MNSKISHAKFLAGQMESGKPVIPRNSSVAKFVVAGQDSGFLSRIRSVSIPPSLPPKVSTSRAERKYDGVDEIREGNSEEKDHVNNGEREVA